MKLYIATPMFGGLCTGFYAQSLMVLQNILREQRTTMACGFIFNESLIQRARNALVHSFLKTDFTHLMFIDADIRFNANDILSMLLADKPILCGLYPKKEINWHKVHAAALSGVPPEELSKYSGSFVVNLKDMEQEAAVAVNEPLEIWHGGTGFMMIKREVFEQMKDHVPSYTNNTHDLGETMGNELVHEFFATSINPADGHLLSEDYHFCRTWRTACQGTVWAAPWVQLEHVGTYSFNGQLVPASILSQVMEKVAV